MLNVKVLGSLGYDNTAEAAIKSLYDYFLHDTHINVYLDDDELELTNILDKEDDTNLFIIVESFIKRNFTIIYATFNYESYGINATFYITPQLRPTSVENSERFVKDEIIKNKLLRGEKVTDEEYEYENKNKDDIFSIDSINFKYDSLIDVYLNPDGNKPIETEIKFKLPGQIIPDRYRVFIKRILYKQAKKIDHMIDDDISNHDFIMYLLKNNLYKEDGDTLCHYSDEEIDLLPMGIINKIVNEIFYISKGE